jgi:phytoene dehydrogenase-like protein
MQLPCYVSQRFAERFFRPFFGGVLLETDGHSRWDYFLWLFNLFTQAQVCLPQGGMAALPQAMARQLPPGALRLNTAVSGVTAQSVTLINGTVLPARAVVMATDGHTATRLMGLPFEPGRRGVTCLYYALQGSLQDASPLLWLNGRGEGLVNNWCFPSVVQPGYAPAGSHLLSVSVLGVPDCADVDLDRLVQAELVNLMPALSALRLLRIYRIPFAQPDQMATDLPQQVNGITLAGDWLATPSLQGAIASGQAAAQHVLQGLSQQG